MKKYKSEKNHKYPLPENEMFSLFVTLDELLDVMECDGTFSVVRDALKELNRSREVAQVIAWFEEHDAHCDGEALHKVVQRIWQNN